MNAQNYKLSKYIFHQAFIQLKFITYKISLSYSYLQIHPTPQGLEPTLSQTTLTFKYFTYFVHL